MILQNDFVSRFASILAEDSEFRTLISMYGDLKLLVGKLSTPEELQSRQSPLVEIAVEGDVEMGYVPEHRSNIIIRVLVSDSECVDDGTMIHVLGSERIEIILQRIIEAIQADGLGDDVVAFGYSISYENFPLWEARLTMRVETKQGLDYSPTI